jgi:two-component system, LytTR family, sensor kinase
MKILWYRKRWVMMVGHALFWALLFFLPFLFRPSEGHQNNPQGKAFFHLYVYNVVNWMLLFYWNAYVLIPRFVNGKKYRLYLLAVTFSILASLVLSWLGQKFYIPPQVNPGFKGVFFNVFPCLFMVATGTALRMVQERIEQERQAKERETENLKTELSFLRSQISPHFMFNVLNNMVALARKKSDDLEPSLIRLSSLLRYMLYEANADKVPLEKEIEYLQSYIDLQKQRFGNSVKISFEQDVQGSYMIEPMLLIPFVENAFKHGAILVPDAFISIQLRVVKGVLYFSVENRYNVEKEEVKDKVSGIGINNVSRRLELLYHGRHQLKTAPDGDRFVTLLTLNLS